MTSLPPGVCEVIVSTIGSVSVTVISSHVQQLDSRAASRLISVKTCSSRAMDSSNPRGVSRQSFIPRSSAARHSASRLSNSPLLSVHTIGFMMFTTLQAQRKLRH